MEKLGTNEESEKSSFWSGFWFPAVFGFTGSILLEFVSLPVAWIVAGVLATCISYFTESKLKMSFIKYFALLQAIVIVTLVVFWLGSQILQEVIPALWAYALPVFLLFNAAYFVPPLDGTKRGAWWKWFIFSLFFSGLLGWLMS